MDEKGHLSLRDDPIEESRSQRPLTPSGQLLHPRQPFTPRSSSFPDDDDSSDSELDPLHRALTPEFSPHDDGPTYEDLPPSYEQATAETHEQIQASLKHDATLPSNLQVHRLTLHDDPTTGPIHQDPRASPSPLPSPHPPRSAPRSPVDLHRALLDQALDFTQHAPSTDRRFAPRLTRRVAIPPAIFNEDEQHISFARAYSKALHPQSITPSEFVAFIDALNVLCTTLPSGQTAKRLLADSNEEEESESTLAAFFSRANANFFAPRGLRVRLASLAELLSLLGATARLGARQSILQGATPEERARALEPYFEPLWWDVPEPAAQILMLREMGRRVAETVGERDLEDLHEDAPPYQHESSSSPPPGPPQAAQPFHVPPTPPMPHQLPFPPVPYRGRQWYHWNNRPHGPHMWPPAPVPTPYTVHSPPIPPVPPIPGAFPNQPPPARSPLSYSYPPGPQFPPPPQQQGRPVAQSWEEWGHWVGANMGEWGKTIGKTAEAWGPEIERWAQGFGKRAETWGQEIGKKAEHWGDTIAKKASGPSSTCQAGPPPGVPGSWPENPSVVGGRGHVESPWGRGYGRGWGRGFGRGGFAGWGEEGESSGRGQCRGRWERQRREMEAARERRREELERHTETVEALGSSHPCQPRPGLGADATNGETHGAEQESGVLRDEAEREVTGGDDAGYDSDGLDASSSSDSEDSHDPEMTFMARVAGILQKHDDEIARGKRSVSDIEKERDKALEKAEKERVQTQLDMESKMLRKELKAAKREARSTYRQEKRRARAERRPDGRRTHAERKSAWKQRKAERKESWKERKEEWKAAKKELKEARKATKRPAIQTEEDDEMVWIVVENLGE